MRYQTQKVAYPFFIAALVLFAAQVIFGVVAGAIYVWPNLLSEAMPFHIVRMSHTNLLIVWLLIGFFGATYYLLPEEAETEIYSPNLAYVQLGLFVFAGAAALVGYQFGIHEGREFLEQPLWVKILMTISFLMFLYNGTMTLINGRRTAISVVLMMGLWLAAIFWLFAFYNPANLSLDKMYWWYVIHLWVEGVWGLIMASLLAYLVIKMTGVDREIIEKWLYVIVGLVLFSGLLGTGHHYYWIGLPGYWQPVGSFFSALEVLPLFAMVIFVFYMFWRGSRNHPNKSAILWTLGCAVMAFFGAGVWGFMHTLSFVNYYSHGTQITAAHAHLAFFGAYVMLNLAIFSYALPQLRGKQPYNQVLNMWSFWLMTSGMAFMTFVLTFAGVIQTHMQRVVGQRYMDVQDDLGLFYTMRLGAGVVVAIAVLMYIYAMLGPAREQLPAGAPHLAAGGGVKGNP
ncbi:cbb3-type cytochrome c oxidase subunit I [Ectothiorhodospira lacustris]|uniref:cbb3-type cytochrome c oxidase subunit I n=1 Tax=Ectothiorhodospira lacustris TaxID=2899127 RepID=UPI001EE8FCC7|nr:cbb3-type cytochrome c oxidase subunit I [Ectothiorhodospira lacustris]MCG5511428.1 cbb3-type cytochrome c oxidase subunit I [Ectothiorhodospira lacustris]MCG5523171.1 cbb3-type cytochrome c oxidase subunit I [Ectothiorhodospira lacustris]